MENFKIGDHVVVVSDDGYPHCIGKSGVIISDYEDTIYPYVYVVEFDFELPPASSVVGKNKRQFFGKELRHNKEYKVLQILRQYEANTKRSKGF